MRNIKETFLKKYSVWEYVLFIGGVLIFGKLIVDYLTDTLEADALDGVAFTLSVLMMSMPMAITEYARKKIGLKTRKEKLKDGTE